MELHRRIDMLSGKLNMYQDSEKKEKIRQMAWITNTLEDDPQILEEMFWPTPDEVKRNNRLNRAAKQWLKEFRKNEKIERLAKGLTINSALNSELSASICSSENEEY